MNDESEMPASSSRANPLLERFKAFYREFSAESIAGIGDVYTQDAEFRDPVHTLQGLLALKAYFRNLAGGLLHYRIRYLDEQVEASSAYYTWELDFAHKSLAGGRVVTVRGMSRLKFTTRVYYHEDCYDLGALIYEQVPLLGAATRHIKRRLAG